MRITIGSCYVADVAFKTKMAEILFEVLRIFFYGLRLMDGLLIFRILINVITPLLFSDASIVSFLNPFIDFALVSPQKVNLYE